MRPQGLPEQNTMTGSAAEGEQIQKALFFLSGLRLPVTHRGFFSLSLATHCIRDAFKGKITRAADSDYFYCIVSRHKLQAFLALETAKTPISPGKICKNHRRKFYSK